MTNELPGTALLTGLSRERRAPRRWKADVGSWAPRALTAGGAHAANARASQENPAGDGGPGVLLGSSRLHRHGPPVPRSPCSSYLRPRPGVGRICLYPEGADWRRPQFRRPPSCQKVKSAFPPPESGLAWHLLCPIERGGRGAETWPRALQVLELSHHVVRSPTGKNGNVPFHSPS